MNIWDFFRNKFIGVYDIILNAFSFVMERVWYIVAYKYRKATIVFMIFVYLRAAYLLMVN